MTLNAEAVALILLRSVAFSVSFFIGTWLFVSWARNHFQHRPLRSLVGWLSMYFLSVSLDALYRVWLWAQFIATGAENTPLDHYLIAVASLRVIALIGLLVVWVRYPSERLNLREL